MNCIGCNLVNKKENVSIVFEDGYGCNILDRNPYNEGHILILPKKHIRYFDELDENTANSVIKASKIISKAIRILFNPDGITVLFRDMKDKTLETSLRKMRKLTLKKK